MRHWLHGCVGWTTMLVTVALLQGCGGFPPCNGVGCKATTEVQLEKQTWQTGDWEIIVEAEGQPLDSCSFTLPNEKRNPCGKVSSKQIGLETGQAGASIEKVNLTYSGREGPEVVTILFERDGERVAKSSFRPDYEERPADCGPACDRAELEMEL